MKSFALILSFFTSLNVFGHGEDKAGPNGGFIKMPAAYHTELVPDGKHSFKVYLLDIDWKNPSIKNSSVELTYEDKLKTKAVCTVGSNFYQCAFPANIDISTKGQISIASRREGQTGNDVTYPLPLKWKSANSGHQGHH